MMWLHFSHSSCLSQKKGVKKFASVKKNSQTDCCTMYPTAIHAFYKFSALEFRKTSLKDIHSDLFIFRKQLKMKGFVNYNTIFPIYCYEQVRVRFLVSEERF